MQVKSRFHSLLEVRIQTEVDKFKEDMADGIVDNCQYWRSVGIVEGLRGALKLCCDIDEDLDR